MSDGWRNSTLSFDLLKCFDDLKPTNFSGCQDQKGASFLPGSHVFCLLPTDVDFKMRILNLRDCQKIH